MIYEFQATQDLHGYSEPWAPGTNENLIDVTEYGGGFYNKAIGTSLAVITAGYTGSHNNTEQLDIKAAAGYGGPLYATDMLEAGDYYISGSWAADVTDPRGTVYVLDEDYVVTENVRSYSVNDIARQITLADSGRIAICIGKVAASPFIFNKLEVNSGTEKAATWTPYENICMPEGFNIWDPTTQEYIQVYAGYVNANTKELYLRPVYQEYAGEELVGPWMSSLDPYEEDATPTEGAFVIDFGGELESFEITPFMLQTLLDSLGIRQHFTNGAGLLNSLMDQAQGRVRSEEELLHLSRPLNVIAIGDQLPAGITIKPISKDVLPGLPGKFIR